MNYEVVRYSPWRQWTPDPRRPTMPELGGCKPRNEVLFRSQTHGGTSGGRSRDRFPILRLFRMGRACELHTGGMMSMGIRWDSARRRRLVAVAAASGGLLLSAGAAGASPSPRPHHEG